MNDKTTKVFEFTGDMTDDDYQRVIDDINFDHPVSFKFVVEKERIPSRAISSLIVSLKMAEQSEYVESATIVAEHDHYVMTLVGDGKFLIGTVIGALRDLQNGDA